MPNKYSISLETFNTRTELLRLLNECPQSKLELSKNLNITYDQVDYHISKMGKFIAIQSIDYAYGSSRKVYIFKAISTEYIESIIKTDSLPKLEQMPFARTVKLTDTYHHARLNKPSPRNWVNGSTLYHAN